MYRCVSFFLDTININSDINAFFPLHDNPQLSIKSCSKYWLYFWHLNLRLQITNIYDNLNVLVYLYLFSMARLLCCISSFRKKRSIIIHIFPFLLNNHFWLDDLLWWVRYFCRWLFLFINGTVLFLFLCFILLKHDLIFSKKNLIFMYMYAENKKIICLLMKKIKLTHVFLQRASSVSLCTCDK